MHILSKKTVLSFFALLFLSLNAYSMGAGIQGSVVPGTNQITGDLKGTVRCMKFPVVFGFGIEAGQLANDFSFGFSGFGDYWIINQQLHNTINFYAGPGIGCHFLTTTNFDWTNITSARAIAGINCLLYDHYIELYLQGGVEPGILIPLTDSPEIKFNLQFPCEIGLRVHF